MPKKLLLICIVVFGIAIAFFLIRGVNNVQTLDKQLVSGFPDFPVHPDLNIDSSQKTQEGFKTSFEANYSGEISASELYVWLVAELPKAGWEMQEFPEVEPGENVPDDFYIRAVNANTTGFFSVMEENGISILTIEFPSQVAEMSANSTE